MEVVELIAQTPKNNFDRPAQDIMMKMDIIK